MQNSSAILSSTCHSGGNVPAKSSSNFTKALFSHENLLSILSSQATYETYMTQTIQLGCLCCTNNNSEDDNDNDGYDHVFKLFCKLLGALKNVIFLKYILKKNLNMPEYGNKARYGSKRFNSIMTHNF